MDTKKMLDEAVAEAAKEGITVVGVDQFLPQDDGTVLVVLDCEGGCFAYTYDPRTTASVVNAAKPAKPAKPAKQEDPMVVKIRAMVGSNELWANRALIVLFEQQTPDEQRGEHTAVINHRGFSKYDAQFLSAFAKQVQAGRRLTEPQLRTTYKCLPKYARQLAAIAAEKAAKAM